MAEERRPYESGDVRPVPDPTVLTTQAQERAIASLRELLETQTTNVKERMDEAERKRLEQKTAVETHLELLDRTVREWAEAHIQRIEAQVEQVRIALQAANEKAETATRVAVADHEIIRKEIATLDKHREQRLQAVRDEMMLIQNASEKAVEKAEVSVAQRLEQLNKVRESSLPRETFDSTVREWTTWREQVNSYMSEGRGSKSAEAEGLSRNQWLIGVVILVAIGVANYLAAGAAG